MTRCPEHEAAYAGKLAIEDGAYTALARQAPAAPSPSPTLLPQYDYQCFLCGTHWQSPHFSWFEHNERCRPRAAALRSP